LNERKTGRLAALMELSVMIRGEFFCTEDMGVSGHDGPDSAEETLARNDCRRRSPSDEGTDVLIVTARVLECYWRSYW
jgi:hypothetical protein